VRRAVENGVLVKPPAGDERVDQAAIETTRGAAVEVF
jgi:hypothetical protein